MKSRRIKSRPASCTKKSRAACRTKSRARKIARRHRAVPSGWLRPSAPVAQRKPDAAPNEPLRFSSLDFPNRHLLYPHEIAERLGCCVRHVKDLIAEGQLRAIDISGGNNSGDRRTLRVPIESWRKFLSERTV